MILWLQWMIIYYVWSTYYNKQWSIKVIWSIKLTMILGSEWSITKNDDWLQWQIDETNWLITTIAINDIVKWKLDYEHNGWQIYRWIFNPLRLIFNSSGKMCLFVNIAYQTFMLPIQGLKQVSRPKPRLQHPFLPENWIFAIWFRQLRSLKLSNLNNTVPDLWTYGHLIYIVLDHRTLATWTKPSRPLKLSDRSI